MFATMSDAAIFIFAMGIGTVYGRNKAPEKFAKSGIRAILYGKKILQSWGKRVTACNPF